ncbi:TBC1 domain family member 14 OS=Homo sapiens GN=TBC1D14 PE=1 SV=3 [Rhizoctonia solani AG-1 IB]|uniref:TBC1 domain family member 14 n=2 Tax=Thanatephorus cucumeris (strain AG1-IB / isolate 7/3/14) TaxID=1108050 RepID=A0A0B7F9Q7_THACB|nr:TBC1 domain family member 14 OS=Homo sapiens GN=TBC1D14 PE=1 SV=3 [Rhizoctonia solani AG-1 IB]
MSSPQSPVGEHARRSTDSDKQPHQTDGVHRSHHIDSGLDVSEDANEDIDQLDMKNISLDDRQEDPSKPSPPAISVPIPITPEREYAYAQEPASTPTPTPKPYTKPTVLSASVALTVNTDVAPEPGLETPSQTDSAPPKTPTPDSAPPMTPVANGSTTPGSSPEKPNVHRQVRSVGPSMLEKVISKTRPTHLPPKNKVEDVKHLKEYEEMMERSRAAEQHKKYELEQRRLARERAVEDSLHIWKREVLPNWKDAIRKPRIRQMWWRGIPTRLRGEMWINAIGNGLAISKDSYKRCLARANRALSSGSFPVETLAIIEEDIRATLPGLHIFHPETGPLYPDLKDLLCAWVVSRSDEGLGYVKGVSSMAGMFLINMPSDDAFICMRNLLERHCMRSFYGGASAKDDIEAYYRIFDTLLADGLPKVFFNFKQHQISPSQYLPNWILPMFLHHLPFEACARIWDVIILEGDSFLYRAALAIIAVIEPRLFFPDRKELMEVLRGENKAALEVARRSGLQADQTARYEQYGMNEEVLWAEIMGMDEWWKESTWSRLIQRELPDV